jgi:hypothetical protein
MLDYNSEKEKYVGNPFNCKFINVSIKEYLSTLKDEFSLSRLTFYFLRNNRHLIAIQFLFQKKENFGSKDPSSFISFTEKDNNKYIGALKNYDPLNKNSIENIEEFTLQLSLGEEICFFSGNFQKDSFQKLNIKTNYGKFFIIGNKKLENTFNFKYFYNGLFFDGLIIGSDNEKITYLKPIIYEDKIKFKQSKINHENKHKKELIDISEDLSMSTKYSPIYKTNIFGTNSNKTIIIDDMERSGLIMDIKEGRAALKEIRIFSNGKKITRIDNQYICYNNKEKDIIISHQSNSYDDTNKNYTIIISKDDYIKDAIIFLSSRKKNVKDVEFTTSKGMKLKISNHKSSNYKELKETKGKKLRILGMCIGSEKYIQFIQFYYEMTSLEI